MFILWVISIIVILSCVLICLSRVRIVVEVFRFRVEVGLLYNNIFGWLVIVCVIFICCFCLLLSCIGKWFVLLVRFISVKIFVICGVILLCFQLVVFRLNVMFCVIVWVCIKLKCWKIILICCCVWCNVFLFSVEIFMLLMLMCFWLGCVKVFRVCSSVFFFVLLVLIMLKILFVVICRFILFIVCVEVLCLVVKLMQIFFILIIFILEIGDGYCCDQGVVVIYFGFWKVL